MSKTAELNDAHRKTGRGWMLTQCVRALKMHDFITLILAVRAFNKFTLENADHDFGEIILDGAKYFWKIDYYAAGSDYKFGSEDPANDEITERVLTVMCAHEY